LRFIASALRRSGNDVPRGPHGMTLL